MIAFPNANEEVVRRRASSLQGPAGTAVELEFADTHGGLKRVGFGIKRRDSLTEEKRPKSLKPAVDEFRGLLSFEYHAYEAILTTAIAILKQDFVRVKRLADELLPAMQEGGIFPFETQKRMASLKTMVSNAKNKLNDHKQCLMTLLDDDESMALMNLNLFVGKGELYG